MSNGKLLNAIYEGVFEKMDVATAEKYFENAKGKYQTQIDKFDRLYKLYKKPDTNGTYDKNIIFELIEAEIDNNIYMPKVRSLFGRTEPATQLEKILKSELQNHNYREFNDVQERFTYIFGGSITYVDWDILSRTAGAGGKLIFKNIDPRCFYPQPGINNINDMDYCFVIDTKTKMAIANQYDLSTEQLQFVKQDANVNIDPDLITVKTMFYKDKFNHICKFVWSGTLVLEDVNNIYSDKLFYCSNCGTLKQPDEDTCIKCHEHEFTLKPVDRKKVTVRLLNEIEMPGGTNTVMPEEHEIEVTPYVPNRFPIVIRKNISSDELFGISDAEMIETSQALNNSLLNKLADRILKSGSLIALPKTLRNKFKVDNSELKLLYYDTPNEANGIVVKTLQPQMGNEGYLMEGAYATARQTLGITNSFQGREDNSAISSKAKAIQVQQTAGRLESKKEMKKAALTSLFELMFQFILAYAYEPKGYYIDVEGKEEFKLYDNRLFLISDEDGNYFYDDEYTFDIDLSASLENNREQMWEETRLNYSSGAYGNPQELQSIKMFWQTMYKLHYPGSKEALDYIEVRLQEQLEQQEMEQLFRQRELDLKQSQIESSDLQNDMNNRTQSNLADAKLLEALNKNE